MHPLKPPRSVGRWAPLAAAILGSAVIAAPAGAAVADPNNAIIVTANASDLLLGGYENTGVTLNRPTIDGGTTTITTGTSGSDPAAPGESGINSAHFLATPADGCWDGFTPQLLPGDEIVLDNGDSTIVQGITAEPMIVQGSTIVIHGTAADMDGNPLPADEIEAMLVGDGLQRFQLTGGSAGNQFLSAQRGDGGGSIAYDAPGSTHWTARYTAINPAEMALAQSASAVGAWTGPAAAVGGGEETDFEVGAASGSNADCAGVPNGANEPRGANVSTINTRSVAGSLELNGVTQPDANAVTVTLTDSLGRTISAPASGSGTWTATVPGAQLASLADGAITVGGTYNNGGGTFKGATMTLAKDAAAPSAPSASVASGSYTSAQNVELKAAEGTIHYTIDGSDPSASSAAYKSAIPVASTQTVKAVAIDAAGNMSPVASFDYAIVKPAPAPVALPKLKLDALTVSSRTTLRTVRKRGIHAVVFAPEGAKVIKVRLLRNGRVITRTVRKVSGDGVMTVVLPSSKKGRRALRRGTYVIQVTAGQDTKHYGVTSKRTIRVR